MTDTQSSSDTETSASRRVNSALPLIIIAVAIIAIAYWVYQRSTHVYTDDARVASDMILITSKVAGLVEALPVTEGDLLEESAVIVQLDSKETRLRLAELQAQLKATESSIAQSKAEILMVERQTTGQLQAAQSQLDAAEANLASVSSDLQFKSNEWQRANTLRDKNLLSQQDWEQSRNALRVAEQAQNASRARVASAQAKLIEAQAARDRLAVLEQSQQRLTHERERVSHQLGQQRVTLEERQVLARQRGIIDQTFIHAGEYILPGQRIAIMHDPQSVWVKANIKETEIRHLQVGQRVEVSVDAYPDKTFVGEVQRIGNAATSQFALLPSTNPSGNFTKVTQRLPVKIKVAQEDELLKPGMMVEIAIEI